jgi:hypothetical protein
MPTTCDYTPRGIICCDSDGSVFVFWMEPIFGWQGKRTYYFDPDQMKGDSLVIDGSLYED